MKMKKVLAIFCVTLLCGTCAFSLACGDTSNSSSPITSEQDSSNSSPGEVAYKITLDETAHTAVEDTSFLLTATITPFGNVKWTTDNGAVASVDEGKVLCKQAGTATITASCGSASASCVVTVTEKDQSFTVLEPDVSAFAIEKGGESVKAAFTAYTVTPNGEKIKIEGAEITYEVANERLVTLDGDEMKAIKGQTLSGSTTVTATYGEIKTTASVTVYDTFISTAAEWNEVISLRNNIGKYYLLTEDIDFANTKYTAVDSSTASAEAKKSFRGTVEGNGHCVKNITFSGDNASLFGALYGAKIRNVCFENVTLSGKNVAGLAAAISSTTEIENVVFDGTFSATQVSSVLTNASSGWNGKFVNSIVKIKGDVQGFVNGSLPQFAEVENVYVLTEKTIQTVAGVSDYLSAIDMAWDVNGQKKLPISAWEYHGGAELPGLLKNE